MSIKRTGNKTGQISAVDGNCPTHSLEPVFDDEELFDEQDRHDEQVERELAWEAQLQDIAERAG